MSGDLPTRRDLRRGITVTVVQDQANNDGEPLVGEIEEILTDEQTHPDGIRVRLHSGVTGRVQEIAPEQPGE